MVRGKLRQGQPLSDLQSPSLEQSPLLGKPGSVPPDIVTSLGLVLSILGPLELNQCSSCVQLGINGRSKFGHLSTLVLVVPDRIF